MVPGRCQIHESLDEDVIYIDVYGLGKFKKKMMLLKDERLGWEGGMSV